MEKIITGKVRKNLSEHTARIILERSDRLASSTLEQLRKSTDRAYTMTASTSASAILMGSLDLARRALVHRSAGPRRCLLSLSCLSTSIRPPMSSTRRLTMASPRPEPGIARAVVDR